MMYRAVENLQAKVRWCCVVFLMVHEPALTYYHRSIWLSRQLVMQWLTLRKRIRLRMKSWRLSLFHSIKGTMHRTSKITRWMAGLYLQTQVYCCG
jgi:hypothetical protein